MKLTIPKFNITDVINEFIDSLNNKKFTEHFKDFDREDMQNFRIEFDNYFHVGFERRQWDIFYDNYLRNTVDNWCKEYNVCCK